MTYRLTAEADADVVRIYMEGARLFGRRQAARYHARQERTMELLAHNPEIARERRELTPPARIHPCGSHVIVYVVEADGGVLVVRVRHAREDWGPAG